MDPLAWLRKQLDEADPDLLREMVTTFAQTLMSAEVDVLTGAPYRERGETRTNRRNGYRSRRWDTRAGTIDLKIPKLRTGSYFPSWLLERRRRSERALINVVAQAYVEGVSTRRVEDLVQALGIEGISKSQVSEIGAVLDAEVESFRRRPLDGGPYRHLWLDALPIRVREESRIVSVWAVLATAVNRDGRREICGLELFTSEDGAAWTAFLRNLVARGLAGVELVTSDAHLGLREAIAAVLAGAAWQRCRVHFMRNLLAKVPKSAQPLVASFVRTIFSQPDAASTRRQHDWVVGQLRSRFPEAAALLDAAREDLLAFTVFGRDHWRQIWSNNPQERLNREIRRRTDVVGIFPSRDAITRLVGAVLVEQHDEWQVTHRYMSLEYLAKRNVDEEGTSDLMTALAIAG
ncbi:MAG TPA: IS256 family transposase [Candidatus Limnocylindria bacterium]|jgi:transposase-like protein|nr:IS256 family transposase [Candidatus Limnocylindria bacterium]